MLKRILCPFHDEKTPSMVLYPEGGYCFGCKKWASNSSLNITPEDIPSESKRPPEDIKASIEYINTLPKMEIRGLCFPCDDTGYFIVWPDKDYYKKRFFDDTDRPKYRNPSGHPQRPLVFKSSSDTVIFIEGEINALSLYETFKDSYNIVCGGGVNHFNSNLCGFGRDMVKALVVMDNDKPAIAAFIEFAAMLSGLYPTLKIKRIFMNEDANEILVKYGKEALKSKINSALVE